MRYSWAKAHRRGRRQALPIMGAKEELPVTAHGNVAFCQLMSLPEWLSNNQVERIKGVPMGSSKHLVSRNVLRCAGRMAGRRQRLDRPEGGSLRLDGFFMTSWRLLVRQM